MDRSSSLENVFNSIYSQCKFLGINKLKCIHQYNSDIWVDLCNYFKKKSFEICEFDLSKIIAENDECLEKLLAKNNNYIPCLTVFGLPLFSENSSTNKKIYNLLKIYSMQNDYIIFFDWVNIKNKELNMYLEKFQLQALDTDYEELKSINEKVKNTLMKSDKYKITCRNGTNLYLERGERKIFQENCNFEAEEKIYQLPGGEVFFAPLEESVNGQIAININGEIRLIPVRNGIAFTKGLLIKEVNEMPIAEIGIGTNKRAKPISALTLGEKAKGTIHIGFGDNTHFGGKSKKEYHFDILIKSPKIKLLKRGNM